MKNSKKDEPANCKNDGGFIFCHFKVCYVNHLVRNNALINSADLASAATAQRNGYIPLLRKGYVNCDQQIPIYRSVRWGRSTLRSMQCCALQGNGFLHSLCSVEMTRFSVAAATTVPHCHFDRRAQTGVEKSVSLAFFEWGAHRSFRSPTERQIGI